MKKSDIDGRDFAHFPEINRRLDRTLKIIRKWDEGDDIDGWGGILRVLTLSLANDSERWGYWAKDWPRLDRPLTAIERAVIKKAADDAGLWINLDNHLKP